MGDNRDVLIILLSTTLLVFLVAWSFDSWINKHDEKLRDKFLFEIASQINDTGEFPILQNQNGSTEVDYVSVQSIFNQGYSIGEIDLSRKIWERYQVPLLTTDEEGNPLIGWVSFGELCQ